MDAHAGRQDGSKRDEGERGGQAFCRFRAELHYLPPFSPQLNPDKQVWKNVKERVAKQKPPDKYSLRQLIHRALQRLQQMPELIRGFFNHPECARTL